MKFKIHYNGSYEDSIIIEGIDMEEIIEIAEKELKDRGWDNECCWSEEIE